MAVLLLVGVLAATVGAGYTANHPALQDGSAYLTKGHTVGHFNGDTGRSDADLALTLAQGKERLVTVRLPDGRLAIVNNDTGTVTFIDTSTMTDAGNGHGSPGKVAAIPTRSHSYLVDSGRNRIENISAGQPPDPIEVPEGIKDAVPAGDSLWLVTKADEVVEVVDGHRGRTVRLGSPPLRITVADDHPVVIDATGQAMVVDGEQPRAIGDTGMTGGTVVPGSWLGPGRYALAVETASGRFVALDPRTDRKVSVQLPVQPGKAHLGAPVMLEQRAYVPDYTGATLWKVNLASGKVEGHTPPVPHGPAGGDGYFDLLVSGGRVWANSQYDQRALVVDDDGSAKLADKGPGGGTTDSQAGTDPAPPPDNPLPPDPAPPAGGADPSTRTVTVPPLPAGIHYQQACAVLAKAELGCEPVAVGESAGHKPDEVLGTNPKSGTQVPVNTAVTVRYVGSIQVPPVTGKPYQQACDLIQTAGLVCVAKVAPGPAGTPDQLGAVRTQDPPGGTPLAKGGKVNITYASPDTVTLGSFAGRKAAEACTEITGKYKMVCTTVEGRPAASPADAGSVYDQNPPAGTAAKTGSTVTLTYYSGRIAVGDYVNPMPRDRVAACAQARTDGFACVAVPGKPALGSGYPPGTGYAQTPAAGTMVDVGNRAATTVTLTYYRDNDLPNYAGDPAWNYQTACADIQTRGFQCKAFPELRLSPQAGRVEAQDQPPGTYPPNTLITIRYSPFTAVRYVIYQKNDGSPVWALRPEGEAPPGYGPTNYFVGWAYRPGTDLTGYSVSQQINGYYCVRTDGRCEGMNTNHFYSRFAAQYTADRITWDGPNTVAVFMACDGQHGKPIYRVFNDVGGQRHYGITDSPAGWKFQEQLGCVWP
jgi:beta-lactam-binding protein with PASTA domain